MSNERIEILLMWQEAALVERDHLVAAREAVIDMLEDSGAGEYPRLRSLNAAIDDVDRTIEQRNARIEQLSRARSQPPVGEPSRLSLLLRRQDEAREDRAALVETREAIQREANAAGQVDLDDEQDRRYRALTREIAEVDDEIAVRDHEIETLAALHGQSV